MTVATRTLPRRRARRVGASADAEKEVVSAPTGPLSLQDLAARVKARAGASGETSYTRKLLDRGVTHCAKKVGEEGVETALAAVEGDRDHLIAEAADLLYHLVVLLEAKGIALNEVEMELGRRTAKSGLDEKASRQGQD
jgi:phosphoribosyl-ATP pyrophosphohydrolase